MKKTIKILTLVFVFALLCLAMTSCGHEHFYGEWVTVKAPTCTETGMQERTCSCGEKETKAIEATGHKISEWTVTKEPTVKEDGEKEKRCSACGEICNILVGIAPLSRWKIWLKRNINKAKHEA